jgi:serine/threonine-protein kinase RsbW
MGKPGHNGQRDLVIPSDPAAVGSVQDDIERALRACQFDDHEVFSIKLALEEALVNAIKHGNQMDRGKQISIWYHVTAERFDVRIVDEGKGFDPQEVPDPMDPENLERPCGRGLLLMRHYMTEVTYHPPGNRLSMTKVRTGRQAGQ